MNRVLVDDVTANDFKVIEELLDAFGKPRDRYLRIFYSFGMFSYADYIAEINSPNPRNSEHDIDDIAATIYCDLRDMSRYFRKGHLIEHEVWELKK